jgi:Cupin
MFDVLTDVLEQVRLAGTLYFSAELRAPWGVSVRPEGRAPFYVVSRGSCLLEVDGEPKARVLAAGDLAVLPRAHAHVLRSDSKAHPVPFGKFVKDHPMDERGFVHCDGGNGPTSTLVGGFFLSQELEATRLLSALPAVVHLRADDRDIASWLEPTLRFIGAEMDSRLHGSRSVLNRLADILFIQAVRAFLSTGEPIHAGWLKGLSDGPVARSLALMHAHYAKPWTLPCWPGRSAPLGLFWPCVFGRWSAPRPSPTSHDGECSVPTSSCASHARAWPRSRERSATRPRRPSRRPSSERWGGRPERSGDRPSNRDVAQRMLPVWPSE